VHKKKHNNIYKIKSFVEVMSDLHQELYDAILERRDLLTRVMNSPNPTLTLADEIRTNMELNFGAWGLIPAMGLADMFLEKYDCDLRQYAKRR
jgi:hypothetical protein